MQTWTPGGAGNVRARLLALFEDVVRTKSALAQMVSDPAAIVDAGGAEALHAAARNVEQVTKSIEGLEKSVRRVVGS